MYNSDEKYLYECYRTLTERSCQDKPKEVDRTLDKNQISGITPKASLILMRLAGNESIPTEEIKKNVLAAKALYFQYLIIRRRNPSCVSPGLENMMERLIRAVCKREAELIGWIRVQETGGERIDIQLIFESNKNLRQLKAQLASTIVLTAIGNAEVIPDESSVVYITKSGEKFHRPDCPYCKGRHMSAVTMKMAENQKLSACRCMREYAAKMRKCNATAFIDESIHPVAWDRSGHKGKAGSYSYIICRGLIKSEDEITETDVLAQGVEPADESVHIERLTECAIGKVLITLAYDYNYSGHIQIYTDNQTAATEWKQVSRNARLKELFQSVKVSYVPREKNRKADCLGRSRMVLNIPVSVYNEVVSNIDRAKTLELQLQEARASLELEREHRQEGSESHERGCETGKLIEFPTVTENADSSHSEGGRNWFMRMKETAKGVIDMIRNMFAERGTNAA